MALVSASRGQQAAVPFWIQWTDGSGQKADPDAPPRLELFRQSAVSPYLISVLVATPTKLPGYDGFYGVSISVTNVSMWPAGTYVALWSATIVGIPTSTTDTFQIFDSADSLGSGAIGSAYCSEAEVRAVTKVLTNTTFTSGAVAQKAAEAAAYINGRLGVRFTVPFGSPYPPLVALLNMWKAAAMLLDWSSSEKGNDNPFAAELHERVDAVIEEILAGRADLHVDPLPGAGTGRILSSTFDVTPDFVRSPGRKSVDLSRF